MKNNEKLLKVTGIISKIAEKALWVCAVVVAVLFVVALITKNPSYVMKVSTLNPGDTLECFGFELSFVDADGNIMMNAVSLFLLAMVFLLSLSAMIFRNVHLILKKAKEETPFCKDVVRMVREIGYFLIATPIVGLIFSVIARLVIDVDLVETSVSFERVLIGLMVICLSGFFSYGEELQEDVDGLL